MVIAEVLAAVVEMETIVVTQPAVEILEMARLVKEIVEDFLDTTQVAAVVAQLQLVITHTDRIKEALAE